MTRPVTARPPGPPLTVVVVDDSPVQRRFLRAAVEAGGEFGVVGEARDGRAAVDLVARLRPGAVLMDLDLPVMGGIEAIERIMAANPTPILVYSAFVAGGNRVNAVEALAAGAVDVLAKPSPEDTKTLEEYAAALRAKLRVAARVQVITHPRSRLRQSGMGRPSTGSSATGSSVMAGVAPTGGSSPRRPLGSATPDPALAGRPTGSGDVRLVVIGASTGGPQALLRLLGSLPPDLAQAVLVVQHMAEGFLPGLACWLDGLVALPVAVGVAGSRLLPGTVTLAPSGSNLLVSDIRLSVQSAPPVPGQFHVPGIDVTFHSVAAVLADKAIGVLLTGMGRDGAAGLLAMRERGALTIGQDEATCAVYGMPSAARALAAVQQELALDDIAPAVLRALGRVPA